MRGIVRRYSVRLRMACRVDGGKARSIRDAWSDQSIDPDRVTAPPFRRRARRSFSTNSDVAALEGEHRQAEDSDDIAPDVDQVKRHRRSFLHEHATHHLQLGWQVRELKDPAVQPAD